MHTRESLNNGGSENNTFRFTRLNKPEVDLF